ncbi:MAG: ABC transporter permease [Planctomycetota bacterium]
MHNIWAVAKNTIKQALRTKSALALILILVILLPVMGLTTTGDGTLKGRLQTFISYGLSLTSLLMCLLTIVLSVYTVTNDIKNKQVFTVLTKPIRRFELILGKLFGVIIFNFCLLAVFGAIIYSVIINMPRWGEFSDNEIVQVSNEFFTARDGLVPDDKDFSKEVNAMYEQLRESGQLDQEFPGVPKSKIIESLTHRKKMWERSAAPGGKLMWEFKNIHPLSKDDSLFIRFKYDVSVNPPDLQIASAWLVGDLRQIEMGAQPITPIAEFPRKDLIRTYYEIEIPSDVVADDGYLAVGFVNFPENNTTVIVDGMGVLYKSSSFTSNYIRAVLLIFVRLVFLACLAVLASSFLSFPVAILLCLAVFATANISGFILESFMYLGENMGRFYSYVFKPLIQLLPEFDRYNPSKFLIPGRFISWLVLTEAVGFMICIKAVLLLLVGIIIFSYREIAKVII